MIKLKINEFIAKTVRVVRNPTKTFIKAFPQVFWRSYAKKARQAGFDHLYLILSFDCDTNEDIAAAEQIHAWLQARGLKAVYAVPGDQLQKGASTYRRLAEDGAEFINHGALPHTEWRDGRYWSVTFYREMSPQAIVEDIHRGHEIVKQVTGKEPTGFRVPHFGLFQEQHELSFLHKTLFGLGYVFSSSTIPQFAMRYGPIWQTDGIIEIPLSGAFHSPLSIFDSWTHIISPRQAMIRETYKNIFLNTINELSKRKITGIINYYVDPVHIYRSAAFYEALVYALDRGISFSTYSQYTEWIKTSD